MTSKGRRIEILSMLAWIYISFLPSCSSVTIEIEGSFDKFTTFQCGSKATLICFIPQYSFGMTWSIDSEIIASCTLSKCDQESDFNYGQVEFEFDRINGIFKMIIPKVFYNVSGREIKCEDGSIATYITLTVKVLPDVTTTRLIEPHINDTDTLTIKAITECVNPSSEISFHWYYYEADKAPSIYQSPAHITEEPYVGTDRVCSEGEGKSLSSKLSIPKVETGKEHYMQIRIMYSGIGDMDPIIKNSTRTYRFENEIHHSTSDDGNSNHVGLIVGLSIGCCVLVVIVVGIVVLIRRRY